MSLLKMLKSSVLISLSLLFSPVFGQDLGELEYEETPSRGIIVDDPSASLLVIESTVKALQFKSRAGIRKVVEPITGIYHVFLPPGIHNIELASEGYLPLKLPRLNLQPKSAKKFRVRAKSPDGVNAASAPELLLVFPSSYSGDLYVQLDSDPLQKIPIGRSDLLLRPTPGQHTINVFGQEQQWQKAMLLQAGMSYTEQVTFSASAAAPSQQSATGGMRIETDPPGALVSLNGIQQDGVTPLTLMGLQAGMYRMEVVLAQHEVLRKEVQVAELDVARLEETLKPTYGLVSIDSDPTGSIVLVDDVQVGVTPYSGRLDPGSYKLRLMSPMYYDTTETIAIAVGKSLARSYKLKARFGTLEVSSDPPGATVTVDGQVWGTTPLVKDRLRSGAYTLTLSMVGYDPQTNLIPLVERETVRRSYKLNGQVGHLQIESEPVGASVYIDGQQIEGTTPLIARDIPVGSRQLVLKLSGHGDQKKRVEVKQNALSGVMISLEEYVEEEYVKLWKVDRQPVPIRKVTPQYPEDASKANITGKVFVTVLVNKQGKVESIGKVTGPSIFAEAAKTAAKGWYFTPAMQDGNPVRVWVSLPFTFALK